MSERKRLNNSGLETSPYGTPMLDKKGCERCGPHLLKDFRHLYIKKYRLSQKKPSEGFQMRDFEHILIYMVPIES